MEAENEAPQPVRPEPLTCIAIPGSPPSLGVTPPTVGVVVPVPSVERYQPPTRPSEIPTSALPSSMSSIRAVVPIETTVLAQVVLPVLVPPAEVVPAVG